MTASSSAAVPVRRLVTGAAAVAVALVVAMVGSAVVLASAGAPSPDDVLARAQRFVEQQTTVSFTRRSHVQVTDGDSPAGFFADSTGEGVAHLRRDAYRVTDQVGDARSEVILVDDERYVRSSADGDLSSERYSVVEDPSAAAARIGVFGDSFGDDGAGPGPAEPHRLPDLVAAARSPRWVRAHGGDGSDDEGDVVGASVSLSALDDRDGVRHIALQLSVMPSGRITRVIVEVDAEGSSVTHDYELSAWGASVDIEAPPPDQIDDTPGIDEAALEAFDDVRLLQPRGIPERWVLDAAFVLSEEETGEDCEQVEIDYVDPDDEERGFLTLYELAVSCASPQPRGAVPFTAGSSTGWILEAVDGDEATFGMIVAGRTVIEFETDLAPEEVAIVLADLAPFDPDVAPIPIGGIGRARTGA